jgi:hypothetical protein
MSEIKELVKFIESFCWKPWVETSPEGLLGSPYSKLAIWKVSRQRPMLGRLTTVTRW